MTSSTTAYTKYRTRSPRKKFERAQARLDLRLGFDGWPIRMAQIARHENLYFCAQELKATGGDASGPDGVSWTDLSNHDISQICTQLGRWLLSGEYRPAPNRTCPIPKPNGGHRSLSIPTIPDRIVGKAVHKAFNDFWESTFHPRSFGYRPRRSTWNVLAELEVELTTKRRRVLVVDDIRKAFDHLPVVEILRCHWDAIRRVEQAHFGPDEMQRTCKLLVSMLPGHDRRTVGIPQGAPYSPTAMNVLLHYRHDLVIQKEFGSEQFWYRYADNIGYLCRNSSEGRRMLDKLADTLAPLGLELKGEDGMKDFGRGESAAILGFSLRLHDRRLQISVTRESLDQLRASLMRAHERDHPHDIALQGVVGWVQAFAPAFESGVVEDVYPILRECGFREISRKLLERRRKESWDRWQSVRRSAGISV